MTSSAALKPLLIAVAFLTCATARADETTTAPLSGDLTNGATRYRLDCAACHGFTGGGDGPMADGLNPHPARLRDGAFFWAHSNQQLIDAITGDGPVVGAPPAAHRLDPLDARDILAWIKQPLLDVSASFPGAVEYIAHVQKIDRDGQDRAEKIMGRPLTEAETKVMVFVVYGPDPDAARPNGRPTKTGEDPASLYNAKPRRRLGYVVYDTLTLSEGPIDALLAMNNDSRLVDVRTMPSPDPKVEKSRERLEKLFRTYIGSGGRMDKKPVEPQQHGLKAPKDVQAAMTLAFERLLEGDAMFQKEERDRFALDPDAFNFPQAEAQPDNVKFDFKQKKQK